MEDKLGLVPPGPYGTVPKGRKPTSETPFYKTRGLGPTHTSTTGDHRRLPSGAVVLGVNETTTTMTHETVARFPTPPYRKQRLLSETGGLLGRKGT